MKTLLVAVRAEDRKQASMIAEREFRVYIASTAQEALPMLSGTGLDGVVCGVHFNDGDPFGFLQRVRNRPEGAALPFIVVKGPDNVLSTKIYRAVELACAHHRVPYLDAGALIQQYGFKAGYAELRRRINELLS